jgi:hypothetical protein
MFPRGRKAEDGRIDERYNLVELSTSSYPARTRKNIEESDGTVIFSLERRLSGGTKLTRELAAKLGKPVLHIYDGRNERRSNPDSLRLEIQALTDFLCSNKIEILSRRDGCGKSDENSLIVQSGECRPTAHSVWQPPEGAYFVGEGLLPTERVSWPLSRRHGYLPRCLSKNSAISPNATAVSGRRSSNRYCACEWPS